MTAVVEVRTGARLHFGLFGTRSPEGRRLGGIGMMIDRPGLALRGRRSASGQDLLRGRATVSARIAEFLARYREALPEVRDSRYEMVVEDGIPPHHGFGSGTQLALAVAAVLSALHGIEPFAPLEPLGRSGRSAVGGAGFFHGGFVLDRGGLPVPPVSTVGASVCRHFPGVIHYPVPEAWRFVVIDPRTDEGVSGACESEAFARLPAMSADVEAGLRDLAESVIAPALERVEFVRFAAGVAEFNRIVGEQFAPVQGGVYAHPVLRRLAGELARTDWPYLAQSSWGPAGVVFCESEGAAEVLVAFLEERVAGEANVFVAGPLNRGASVEVVGGPRGPSPEMDVAS